MATQVYGFRSLLAGLGVIHALCALSSAEPPSADNSGAILTPPAPETPRINGAAVFGVRPGSPVIYHVPVTGLRPVRYSARGLPEGVKLDEATGNISGVTANAGTYKVALHAENAKGSATREFRMVVGDTIALTPPMGWNSYNVWSDQIDQERELAAAKAMVSSGLIEHGWAYVNMDDGWQGQRGGALKAMQPDPRKFTEIKAMCDDIHGMGLKVGIYGSPWVTTYAGRPGGSAENEDGTSPRFSGNPPKNQKQLPFAIGKYHFTSNDAKQFAEWGIDYLKYDWGPVEYPETKEMWDALRAQNRDIVFSLSNNHVKNLFKDIGNISTVANAWRTTTDITDNWGRVSTDIGFAQDDWAPYARPGRYNDADMLVVGVVGWGAAKQHPTKLTVDEQYTHISLWCLLSSPLLLGCDLTKLDAFTVSLLTNDEVLAVNQDALVKQAVHASRRGQLEVFRKELEDGSIAVGLFNRGATEAAVTASWSDLKLSGKRAVRDLWRQKDLGSFEDSFTSPVNPHGVVLVKIST
ncbi:MAG TPA: putative Ig domain-containing protein, partial [Phycisphaerae bacterium]